MTPESSMANVQSPVATGAPVVRSGIPAEGKFTHLYTQEGQFIPIGGIKRLIIGPNEAGNSCVFAEMEGPVPVNSNPKGPPTGNMELRRNVSHDEALEYAQHFMQPGIDFVYCDLGNEYVNPMFASEFDYANRPYFVIE